MKFARQMLVLAISGALAATAFPPFNFVRFLLPAALFIWYSSLHETKRGGRLSLAFGLGYFAVLLKWMNVVGTDTWIALTLICASWWALAGYLISKLEFDSLWSVKLAFIMTSAELLRDRVPFNGFGWGQFGIIAVGPASDVLVPAFGQVALTFFVILSAAEFVRIRKGAGLGISHYGAIVTLVVLIGAVCYNTVKVDTGRKINVSLVQGGVVHTGLGTFGPPRSVLKNHIEVTLANLAQLRTQDLVIWPESSSDLNPFSDALSHSMIVDAQRKLYVPLLIGANVDTPDGRVANDSVLWKNSNAEIVYQKRRLVPFGEFMPFRSLITQFTDRVQLMPRDFAPGFHPGLMNIKNVHLGVLICFEIADDSLALDTARNSSAIIVHTNNATYQNLGQSEQQLLYARIRALETRRPVLVVSTSGISAVIDADGEVSSKLTQTETGILTASIAERSGSTPAMLLHGPFVVCIFAGMAWSLVGLRKRRRKVQQ